MNKKIILVTGSREVDNLVEAAVTADNLLIAEMELRGRENLLVMHGAAAGWDTVFGRAATRIGVRTAPVPSNDPDSPQFYQKPLARNEYMVGRLAYWRDRFGYDVECWTFADRWASGTGHCARRARRANIPTIDFRKDTV